VTQHPATCPCMACEYNRLVAREIEWLRSLEAWYRIQREKQERARAARVLKERNQQGEETWTSGK